MLINREAIHNNMSVNFFVPFRYLAKFYELSCCSNIIIYKNYIRVNRFQKFPDSVDQVTSFGARFPYFKRVFFLIYFNDFGKLAHTKTGDSMARFAKAMCNYVAGCPEAG